jgi:hypothetical protein
VVGQSSWNVDRPAQPSDTRASRTSATESYVDMMCGHTTLWTWLGDRPQAWCAVMANAARISHVQVIVRSLQKRYPPLAGYPEDRPAVPRLASW